MPRGFVPICSQLLSGMPSTVAPTTNGGVAIRQRPSPTNDTSEYKYLPQSEMNCTWMTCGAGVISRKVTILSASFWRFFDTVIRTPL